jgi:hypothetical protein
MKDSTIITKLRTRKELPTVHEMLLEFRCSEQQATRVRDALREEELNCENKITEEFRCKLSVDNPNESR